MTGWECNKKILSVEISLDYGVSMIEPSAFKPEFKRFIRLDFNTYYPSGGMADASGSYDTLEDAMAAPSGSETKSIFDCNRRIVLDFDGVTNTWIWVPTNGGRRTVDPCKYQ